ncbi:MAG TPA: L-threonylcarbamoyladenylate synthase [Pyrinomonadaceae bacterium]|jgi:L-threonylcarbamoyladenylate synthase|nr:L-threonylcarbamoyladenylate synthase [Pyrinomonadaceae bacterium]
MILRDSQETRRQAAALVKAGGLIAFRTDTFYGLGADPFNRDALRQLRALKGRDDGKPILLVISDAPEVARFSPRRAKFFDALSARHWPGALTLVVSAHADLPAELTAGTGTIGLRLPDDEAVRALVRACGGALTATSANLAGEPPARTAEEVERAFPAGLALIVDGGATHTEAPSTVLDVAQDEPRLIREGAVSWRELEETIETVRGQ